MAEKSLTLRVQGSAATKNYSSALTSHVAATPTGLKLILQQFLQEVFYCITVPSHRIDLMLFSLHTSHQGSAAPNSKNVEKV
jgi:hypothetical protein